jgi:hypothetical protein
MASLQLRSGIVDQVLPMTDEQREEVSEVPLTSRVYQLEIGVPLSQPS